MSNLFGVPFKDLGDEAEDERIRQIGEKCLRECLVVGFITDDEPGKPDRYVRKLEERFPGIRVVHRGPGPAGKTVLVKVAPPFPSAHLEPKEGGLPA